MVKKISRDIFSYLGLVPALIIFIGFRAWPLIKALILSFYEVNVISGNRFIGVANYSSLLSDPPFLNSIKVTILFTAISVPLMVAWSLVLALAVSYKLLKGKIFFRGAIFMPMITSWVVISIIWKWFFSTRSGVINILLNGLNIIGPNWLGDPRWAFLSVILVTLWKLGGLFMVIFLSNLQIIDPTLYEAAGVDGASILQKFRHITIYQLRPAFILSTTLGTLFLFRTFSIIFCMTYGDPDGATDLLAYHIYNLAFRFFNFGQALAGIVFMFGVVCIFLLMKQFATERG